jgi:hypothetical protein
VCASRQEKSPTPAPFHSPLFMREMLVRVDSARDVVRMRLLLKAAIR